MLYDFIVGVTIVSSIDGLMTEWSEEDEAKLVIRSFNYLY
jgi:hypothetical protein